MAASLTPCHPIAVAGSTLFTELRSSTACIVHIDPIIHSQGLLTRVYRCLKYTHALQHFSLHFYYCFGVFMLSLHSCWCCWLLFELDAALKELIAHYFLSIKEKKKYAHTIIIISFCRSSVIALTEEDVDVFVLLMWTSLRLHIASHCIEMPTHEA